MPIPKPKADETQDDFVERCMGNETMKDEYPENDQRLAVCMTAYREKREVKNHLARLATNLSGDVRIGNSEGREWLICPMVMIVEGVLNGSHGALYYPAEELSKTPEAWNHKPVVVDHPQVNGSEVSACSPEIVDKYKVGMIYNAKFDNGRLVAEAWLDKDRVEQIDERVAEAIENNVMLELSTGLFVDVQDEDGEFQNQPYDAIARNYRPDHLALLPDKVGACSIQDGAGFLRNALQNDLRGKFDRLRKILLSIGEDEAKDFDDLVEISLADNELSHGQLRDKIQAAIRSNNPTDGSAMGAYVIEVYPDWFVWEDEDMNLYRQSYSVGADDEVSISGIPEAVERKYEYAAVENGRRVENVSYIRKESNMQKETIVNALIDSGVWNEDRREWLMEQSADTLSHLQSISQNDDDSHDGDGDETEKTESQTAEDQTAAASPSPEAAVAPTGNAERQPETLDEYVAKAPKEIREVLTHGVQAHREMKRKMVDQIVAHESNILGRKVLESKSIDDLSAMVALLPKPKPTTANYAGQGEVESNNDEEPLDIPQPSFE